MPPTSSFAAAAIFESLHMPLIELKTFSPASRLGIWETTEPLETLEQEYAFAANEAAVYQSFAHPFRKVQWLSVRLLLAQLLPGTRIVYDENGKPHPEGKSDVHLSVSHSASYIAVMISDRPCGVDIEIVREKIDRIAPRFLCEEELTAARRESVTERLHVYWCVKEAVYKVSGKKNVSLRTDIFVSTPEETHSGKVIASLRNGDEWTENPVQYERFRDCMLAWTIPG